MDNGVDFVDTFEDFDNFKIKDANDFIIRKNGKIFERKIKASQSISFLSQWNDNRSLDLKHKEEIKQGLIEENIPYLFGKITLIADKNVRLIVIDGQHRIEAIKELLNEKKDFDCIIDYTIYQIVDLDNIDNINSDIKDEINKIFNIVNKSLPINCEDKKESKSKELTECLSSYFNNNGVINIRITNGEMPQKPCISHKSLKDIIFNALPLEFENICKKKFVKYVAILNDKYDKMTIQEFYGRKNPSQQKVKQHQKASERKFYLNLDGGNGNGIPSEWLKQIFEQMSMEH